MKLISRKTVLMFFIPGAIFMAAFLVFPLLKMFIDSFFEFSAFGKRLDFIGLDNYIRVVSMATFRKAFGNTAAYVAISVIVEMLLGTALAFLFSTRYKPIKPLRSLMLSPLMMAPIVTGLIWRFMLSAQFGIINTILVNVGFLQKSSDILWLGDQRIALLSCTIADIWLTTPFIMMMVLAGINSLDEKMLEAARIDGAGTIEQIFKVMLPNLKPIMMTALSIRIVDAARSFDIIWAMTQGGPNYASEMLSTIIYKTLVKNNQIGLASAMAVIFVLVLIIFTLIFMQSLWRTKAGEG